MLDVRHPFRQSRPPRQIPSSKSPRLRPTTSENRSFDQLIFSTSINGKEFSLPLQSLAQQPPVTSPTIAPRTPSWGQDRRISRLSKTSSPFLQVSAKAPSDRGLTTPITSAHLISASLTCSSVRPTYTFSLKIDLRSPPTSPSPPRSLAGQIRYMSNGQRRSCTSGAGSWQCKGLRAGTRLRVHHRGARGYAQEAARTGKRETQ